MTFPKRTLYLRNEAVRDTLLALVRNLPVSGAKPLQVVIEEYKPPRKPDQNSLMWVGPLRDIASQAWLEGRQYSAEVWHEFFKRELLPEEYDPELCLSGYEKWAIDPAGNRVLIGSTTKLTVKGMAQYITELHAFGGNIGVEFSAKEQA